jgi:hypothetical protein
MAQKKNSTRKSSSVKKLDRTGRNPRTVKDPSNVKNRPRQGGPVPQTESSNAPATTGD